MTDAVMRRLGFAGYSIIAEPFAAESIYQGQVHDNQRLARW